ncbi:MAG: hypothetical protein R3F62_26085 [Planctomycetota bacterium]
MRVAPGGAAAVGWLAGALALAAGGYLLGVAPGWSVPTPLLDDLGWTLGWVALHGRIVGGVLAGLGLATLWGAARRAEWTGLQTALSVGSLAGVSFAVAVQAAWLGLEDLQLARRPAEVRPSTPREPVEPAPTPTAEAPPLVPAEELLARLDARNGPKNLGVVDALIQHRHAAVEAIQRYVLRGGAGAPYAVFALTQILQREGTSDPGLLTLLACLDPELPAPLRAQAATGLTLLADPRTVEVIVARYRGQAELREALFALTGELFADAAAAALWFEGHKAELPTQLAPPVLAGGAPRETPEDRTAELLGLLRDSGDTLENVEVVGELRRIGTPAIPGLLELAERRVDGSGWAAQALARVLKDLPPSERPEGALEVLVTCVNAEADYVLQAQALEGLLELSDPRTLQALLAHLDHPRSAVRVLCQELCERLTGERFQTRAGAEAWWRAHGADLAPQVGVAAPR